MRTERVQTFEKWTEAEDDILREMMERGASASEKAAALPRRTLDAIKRRQDRLKNPDSRANRGGKKPPSLRPVGRPPKSASPEPEVMPGDEDLFKPKKITFRKCLTCAVEFPSEGAHNRLCPTHRAGSYGMEYTLRFR